MITYKALEKDDFSIINRYLLLDKTRSCEKTVGALMMWRDFYKIEWAIFDETLIIKYNNEEKPYYMIPIGANVDGAMAELGSVAYTGVCKEHFGKFSKNAEFIPIEFKVSTWSFIKDISGEITIVIPSKIKAGI